MSFLKEITKDLDNSNVLDEEKNSSEFSGYIDTGCYIFNAVLSGSIYGGIPNSKVTAIAGESSTGKTFVALGMVKSFLESDPEAGCIYFDTEAAVTKQMMLDRGIDPKRVVISEPTSIEEFRTTAVKILDSYIKNDTKPPMMMVLDSMGMLSSKKELEDVESGKEARDMTKSQLLRGTFRVLSLKLAKAHVPMVVTNHTYDIIGCLDDSQFIRMGDNTLKNITDIVVGDNVITQDGIKPVSELFQYNVEEYYEMVLDDGTTIKATPNHKFLTAAGEWKRIDELFEGEDLSILSN